MQWSLGQEVSLRDLLLSWDQHYNDHIALIFIHFVATNIILH